MQKTINCLILCICTARFATAQIPNDTILSNAVDSLLTALFKVDQPGCVVLIAKKGQVIYKKAYGSADLELKVAMRPDMIFRLGSITKQYTAVAILQLVEQGKISLQDSIQKFIKSFPYKGHIITIENLLTHTSGIIEYQKLDIHIPYSWRIDFPPKQIVDSLATQPLEFSPGTKFSYSNSNFFLLGYIIQIVSGMSYPDYMRRNIFAPIGLVNTYYDDANEIISNRVSGYFVNDSSQYENAEYVATSQAYSAGALMSNAEDLFHWHQALYAGKLIKPATLQNAFTPFRLSDATFTKYGYGWYINPTDGIKSIEHAGKIDGFRSNEIYLPDEDIFIATLFNFENDQNLLLANTIAALAVGKQNDGKPLSNSMMLDSYIGVYQMVTNPNRTITIIKRFGQIFIQFSPSTSIPMMAQTESKFTLQGVTPPATVEFVKENGKTIKLIVSQKGLFEWKKIK
jgi:CubicO group peptidase (beta-lactamase class C family)